MHFEHMSSVHQIYSIPFNIYTHTTATGTVHVQKLLIFSRNEICHCQIELIQIFNIEHVVLLLHL